MTLFLALLLAFSPDLAHAKAKTKQPAEVYSATDEAKTVVQPVTKYDAVPADQVQPLLKRLRLVEELITRHGRAYDYRVLTTKELETVLQELSPQIQSPPQPINEP